jgi:hypothetical protein
MAMKHNYDIFISYRRSSYETANLIATRLKSAGYRVFFDLESMRSGPFNEQLFNVIEGCRDFVIVLPPDALERCSNEEDWVRKEVLCAMSHKKNIIPVMLNGFVWPNPMPQGMEELRNYQAVAAGSIEYFDMSMKRLESYLNSTRHTKQRVFAKWFILSTLSIAAILLSLFFVFRSIAKPLCKEFAQHQTLYAGIADFLIDDNKKLALAMDEYKSNTSMIGGSRVQSRSTSNVSTYVKREEKNYVRRYSMTKKRRSKWIDNNLEWDEDSFLYPSLRKFKAEEAASDPDKREKARILLVSLCAALVMILLIIVIKL